MILLVADSGNTRYGYCCCCTRRSFPIGSKTEQKMWPVFTPGEHASHENVTVLISRMASFCAGHQDEILVLRKDLVENPTRGSEYQHLGCLVLTTYLCTPFINMISVATLSQI